MSKLTSVQGEKSQVELVEATGGVHWPYWVAPDTGGRIHL